MQAVPKLSVSAKQLPADRYDPAKTYTFRYRGRHHGKLPHVVKFSGGRSSGMLLFTLLENGLLRQERGDVVVFNNTSSEHPETYRFASANAGSRQTMGFLSSSYNSRRTKTRGRGSGGGFRATGWSTTGRTPRATPTVSSGGAKPSRNYSPTRPMCQASSGAFALPHSSLKSPANFFAIGLPTRTVSRVLDMDAMRLKLTWRRCTRAM